MLKTASLRRMRTRLQRAPGFPGRVLTLGGDSLVWRPFGRASSRAWATTRRRATRPDRRWTAARRAGHRLGRRCGLDPMADQLRERHAGMRDADRPLAPYRSTHSA